MIFILGIERSATTWISSILDCHPRSEVLMEPLSGFNSRFLAWPSSRFSRIAEPEAKAAYFRREFKALRRHRHLLLTRFSNARFAWQFDLGLAELLVRKQRAPAPVNDFYELNFHRRGLPDAIAKEPPLQTVIKELRLNFNADLLPRIDDSARVVVAIREMASCVRSMQRQLQAGNLVDLQRDLQEEYGQVDLNVLADYWLRSYAALMQSLQAQDVPFTMVSHTELLHDARGRIGQLLAFLQWAPSPAVDRYIEASDRRGSGKHDTRRRRSEQLKQMEDDRAAIYPQIRAKAEEALRHPELKPHVRL